MKLTKEGYASIAITGIIMILSAILAPILLIVTLPLLAITLWFFRDPERFPPKDEKILVSPADGQVIEIFETEHPYTGKALKVGIFMNAFNVHVNRMPSDGVIDYLSYVPGKKLVASGDKASDENERMYIGYQAHFGKVLLVQIAGLLARRIVCRLKLGDRLNRSQRFGMIKLGSKVDVYLPSNVECLVKKGQKVKAGETPIGKIS